MNTPAISAALPAAPQQTGRSTTGASAEPEGPNASFSTILTGQQAPKPAPSAVAHGSKGKDDAKGPAAQDSNAGELPDETLAELATEQGLSLPQIALNIATEAALTVAAQLPRATASRGLPADTHGSTADDTQGLTRRAVPLASDDGAEIASTLSGRMAALAAEVAVATKQAKTATASAAETASHATTLSTPVSKNTAEAISLPAGFVPAHNTGTPGGIVLNGGKPALGAARQTQLMGQAQTRVANTSPVKTSPTTNQAPSIDFAAAMANVASSKAATADVAPQIDLNAAMAGSIAATGGTAAGSPLLSGNMGSGVNTAVPAMPGIATPLQNPQWASDFGRQFVSLTQGGHNMPHTAELRLDPPELGPLRISINISDNVAHAIFVSPHAAVRQTVENALPQLQQLLAQSGISLGQTSVNDQAQSDQAYNESFGSSRKTAVAGVGSASGDVGEATLRASSRSPAPNALVDTFA
ncbi:hypothetical protein EKL30_00685 [Candidimonas sp. SYP-B2681]|uniref:flagellar hook-length control protein FliK n=1 Tax=Candidimonas sp. SYP-B2681 TaxID=2497686 RepID=UPI000F88AFBF|nr:flagellar hook-length control protein FliK [Candidimonas sp. SYP-B2681]RTZ47560.1 hypothetical protein EKL30_00685 [Candidimonas sp. SYP-B2681]